MIEFYALYDSETGLYQVLYASDGYPAQDTSGRAVYVTREQALKSAMLIQNDEA
jgi:hypothetical protein